MEAEDERLHYSQMQVVAKQVVSCAVHWICIAFDHQGVRARCPYKP